jgi:ferric-dicitrate binding protein FerR (iron transport regulator)
VVESLPAETDIAPGGNRATLTLADGSVILLDDAMMGKIAEQEGMKVTKAEDGLLTYTFIPSEKGVATAAQFNTISTPKGGQYQIVLADGTKVWLNAASSLTFPTSFTGNERSVELSGEGYFEVNTVRGLDVKNIPFIVKTADQEVTVLGTHFNINSYADEASTITTLMEGSIQVSQLSTSSSKLLKPGQQSVVTLNKGINVSTVNSSSAMAWKNGLFQFEGSDIKNVMRQFSRWYDVEVEFESRVPDIKLWGEVYRNVNASQALEILEYFNLKYKIVQTEKGKKVIVS